MNMNTNMNVNMNVNAKPGESKDEKEVSKEKRDDRMALLITYINIILYALCYQLQRPVEPFLVKSLTEHHDDPAEVSLAYGRLNSFFSAIQTVGSPLVGILLDRVGIRHASAIVFLASAASYAILSTASSMQLLFISKIPTALQHAFLVAQATAATSTGNNAAARAQALGRMTTAYTIGATIGPALGGIMADQLHDLYLGAKLAVVGSLISVFLSLVYLPNKIQTQQTQTQQQLTPDKSQRTFAQELQHTLELALRPNLWPLLAVKVLGGIAASMHSTALPLVLTQTLQFDSSQLGITMSSSMFAVAGFGAFCMAPMAKSLGPPGMAKFGLAGRALLGPILAVIVTLSFDNSSTVLTRVVLASVIHALVSHLLATGLTTQTTGAVQKNEQGMLLGLEHGLFSMARIGAPTLGTTLLATGGFWTVAATCGVVDILLVGALIATASQTQQPNPSSSKWPDEEHSD